MKKLVTALTVAGVLLAGCAWVEKNDPVVTYPTASGYCPLDCTPFGCCPYGGADDGYVCSSPEDKTGEICHLDFGGVGPADPGDRLGHRAYPDAGAR